MLSVLSKLCGSPNPSKSDNEILIELLSDEQLYLFYNIFRNFNNIDFIRIMYMYF